MAMFRRFYAWDEMGGGKIAGEQDIQEALHLAGLDYEVYPAESYARIFHTKGRSVAPDGRRYDIKATGMVANYCSDNGQIVGNVGQRYEIVQNREAFDFLGNLLGELELVTAGTTADRRVSFVLAKADPWKLVGEDMENYILIANSFDGSSAVKVVPTNVRVWCKNTLNLALKTATRKFSFHHKGDINFKLEQAKRTLQLNEEYKKALAQEGERLALQKITRSDAKAFLDRLFPLPKDNDISARKLGNIAKHHNDFMNAWESDDLADIRMTKWGLLNAVSDMVYHSEPVRTTQKTAENRLLSVIDGNKTLDLAYELLS